MGLIKQGKTGASLGAVSYVWRSKFAVVLGGTFDGTRTEVLAQFLAWGRLRPSLTCNTLHIIESYDPQEKIDDKIMVKRARRMSELLDFEGCPYLVVKHTDTEHPHMHIVVIRIRLDGSVVSDSLFALKAIVVSKYLDKEFGMIETAFQFRSERIKRNEYEMMKRTGKLSEKKMLAQTVAKAAGESKNLDVFLETLKDTNIDVRLYLNKSKTDIRGISFSNEKMTCAGSKLGRGFSFPRLAEKLKFDAEREFPKLSEKLKLVSPAGEKQTKTSDKNKLDYLTLEVKNTKYEEDRDIINNATHTFSENSIEDENVFDEKINEFEKTDIQLLTEKLFPAGWFEREVKAKKEPDEKAIIRLQNEIESASITAKDFREFLTVLVSRNIICLPKTDGNFKVIDYLFISEGTHIQSEKLDEQFQFASLKEKIKYADGPNYFEPEIDSHKSISDKLPTGDALFEDIKGMLESADLEVGNNEITTNFDENIYQRNLKLNQQNEKSIRPRTDPAGLKKSNQNDPEFDRATRSENLRATDNSEPGEFGKHNQFISPNQLDKSRSDVVGNTEFAEEIGREGKDFGKEKRDYDPQDSEVEMATRIESSESVEETRIIREILADLQDDGFDNKTVGSREDFAKNEIGNIIIGKTDKNTTLRNRQFGAIESYISGAGEESNNGIAEIEQRPGVIFGDRHDAQIGLDQKSSQAGLINDESSDEFHQGSSTRVEITQKTNIGFGNEGNKTGEKEIGVRGNHLDLDGQSGINFKSNTETEQLNKSKISDSRSDNFDGDSNDIAVRGNAYVLETESLSNNSVENTVLEESVAENLLEESISRENPQKIDFESEKNLPERGVVISNTENGTESGNLYTFESDRETANKAAQIINLKFYNAQLEQEFISEWSSIIEKSDAKSFLNELLTKSKTEDLKEISQMVNKQAEFISAKLTLPLPKLQTKSEPGKLALALAKIETANYESITGEKINPKTVEVLAEKKLSFAHKFPSAEQTKELEEIFENLPVRPEIASYLEAETLTALINPQAVGFDEEEIEHIQESVERNIAASREMATLIQLSYGGQADKFTDNFKSDLAERIYDLPAPATEIYDHFRDFDWQKRGELFSPHVNNVAEQYGTEIEFPQTSSDRNNHLTDFVALQIKNAYELQNEPINQNTQNKLTEFVNAMTQNESLPEQNNLISDLMKNELEPPVFSSSLEADAYIFDNQEIEETEAIAINIISNISLEIQDEERNRNQMHLDEEEPEETEEKEEEEETEESLYEDSSNISQ